MRLTCMIRSILLFFKKNCFNLRFSLRETLKFYESPSGNVSGIQLMGQFFVKVVLPLGDISVALNPAAIIVRLAYFSPPNLLSITIRETTFPWGNVSVYITQQENSMLIIHEGRPPSGRHISYTPPRQRCTQFLFLSSHLNTRDNIPSGNRPILFLLYFINK